MKHRSTRRRSLFALSRSLALVFVVVGMWTGCAPAAAESEDTREPVTTSVAEPPVADRLWVALGDDPGAVLSFGLEQLAGRSPFTPLSRAEGAAFAGPSDLAFDPDGNLWVANFDNETVAKFDPAELAAGDARPLVILSGEALEGGPSALAFDRAGTLWVGTFSDRILAYPAALQQVSGSPAPTVAITRNYAYGLPQEMAFDAAGNLWTVHTNDVRLTMHSASQLAGDPDAGDIEIEPALIIDGLAGPDALAFDRVGNLWVADYDHDQSDPRSGRIVRFDAATLEAGAAPDFVIVVVDRYRVSDLGFDADGALWALESGDNALLQFTPRQLSAGTVSEPASRFVFAGGDFDQSAIAFGP